MTMIPPSWFSPTWEISFWRLDGGNHCALTDIGYILYPNNPIGLAHIFMRKSCAICRSFYNRAAGRHFSEGGPRGLLVLP